MRCAWRCPRVAGEDGWTLMETMVVTSIIAILTGIAVPQFAAIGTQMRTNTGANQVLTDIEYARVMAQRTGVAHYIETTGGTGVNYRVMRVAVPPEAGPQVVRTSSLGSKLPGVVFAQNGSTTDCFGTTATQATPTALLSFNARGLPSAATSYFVGSNDGTNSYVVSVSGAGRVRLCRNVGGTWH